jgi:hypothetical protein
MAGAGRALRHDLDRPPLRHLDRRKVAGAVARRLLRGLVRAIMRIREARITRKEKRSNRFVSDGSGATFSVMDAFWRL